VMVSAVTLRSQ